MDSWWICSVRAQSILSDHILDLLNQSWYGFSMQSLFLRIKKIALLALFVFCFGVMKFFHAVPPAHAMVISAGSDSYVTYERIPISAIFVGQGASVQAVLRLRDSTTPTATLTLFDDGKHKDSDPNDGTYSNEFAGVSTPGKYVIDVTAVGTTDKGDRFNEQQQVPVTIEDTPTLPADLFISVTGPSTVVSGSQMEYSVVFGNKGPANADVHIDLLFPDEVKEIMHIADTVGEGEQTSYGHIWLIKNLEAGSRRNATVKISVPSTISVGTEITAHFNIEALDLADYISWEDNQAETTTKVIAANPALNRDISPIQEISLTEKPRVYVDKDSSKLVLLILSAGILIATTTIGLVWLKRRTKPLSQLPPNPTQITPPLDKYW